MLPIFAQQTRGCLICQLWSDGRIGQCTSRDGMTEIHERLR